MSEPLQAMSQLITLPSKAGGGDRQFLLHLPTNHQSDFPSPLVICFHGKGQKAAEIEAQTQLSDPAFNRDAIVVYPQGIKDQWTGDPEAPPTTEINDIAFTSDLLSYLIANYPIDRRRIYAAGFSNGGGLVGLLANDPNLSCQIAAFAAAAGAFYQDEALGEPLFSQRNPGRKPIPFIEFHGDHDPVEHYDGKGTPDGPSYSLTEWMEGWAKWNGCDNPEKEKKVELMYDGGVEKYTWSCGGNEDVVVHYKIHGFGHGWPSNKALDNDHQRYGPTCLDATPIMLEWFQRWKLE